MDTQQNQIETQIPDKSNVDASVCINSTDCLKAEDLLDQAEKTQDGDAEVVNGVNMAIEVIEIPMDTVGLVIGKNGTQIKSIQGATGCFVQMAGSSINVANHRQVTLQGAKHQIEHAKVLINNIVRRCFNIEQNNNGYPSSRPPSRNGFQPVSDLMSINVMIPQENCGWLVGKGGENIKNLQEKLGVKLGLIQSTKDPIGPKPLQIIGYASKVENAHRFIMENYVNQVVNQNKLGDGDYWKNNSEVKKLRFQLGVPRDSVGRIIGKNGQTIKWISSTTGAKVEFSLSEDQNGTERTVIIDGTTIQVNNAAKLVRELCNDPTTNYISVPADRAGLVIGKSGTTVRQICHESGAKVQISKELSSNSHERVFQVMGNIHQIQTAIQMIKQKIGDLSPDNQTLAHLSNKRLLGSGSPSFANVSLPQSYSNMTNYVPTSYAGRLPYATPNAFSPNGGGDYMYSQAYSQPQAMNYSTQPTYSSLIPNNQQQTLANYLPLIQQYMPQQQLTSAQLVAPYQFQQPTATQMGQLQSQEDFSNQWIQFYRDIGMYDQAVILENKVIGQAPIYDGSQIMGQPANYANNANPSQPAQCSFYTASVNMGQ